MDDSEIYASVRRDLMRYATALTGPDAADDVVSVVVTRSLARSGGLAGLREPKHYLMKSVLNEVRSRHRSQARRSEAPAATYGAVDDIPDSSTASIVDAVIASLPPRQRAAAFLVFHEEYTPSEAAAVMGCRPATVRRYLHLARTRLREALDG
ncbi:MAG: RNA polymerase sigma factor [Armatimonadetes bacterium]|nr:MAG: RNA polymerase sigma factor [Armatimonadota bacterium]